MPDRTHAFLHESLTIGPLLAPVFGLGDEADPHADFPQHVAGFAMFEKVFSAHEECAKTTT
jgi:hypothetical protein